MFIHDDGLRALLESVAGNSPYLARGILAEREFLSELFALGPDRVLSALNDEALSVATLPGAHGGPFIGLAATPPGAHGVPFIDMAATPPGAHGVPFIDMAATPPSESEVMRALRIVKRRVALAVALADIGGAYDLEAVTGALTRFADCAVRGALRFLLAGQARKTGLAKTAPETLEATTGLIVLAMGKHGAFELNYSSDIDLVVFYDIERFPFAVQGEKGRAAVGLVKGLLRLLAESTADGYVFRVDLRLRPDAGATQVAISTEAAELYYESVGQNWERAAMIKARACAGDGEASSAFLQAMTPFVWRKYLDYAAIEDIHSIKRQIHAHGGHERIAVLGHNIKLGRGGIREIEFFTQTQQLILGGRDPSLRDRTTLGALAALRGRGLISVQAESDLAAAYRFLRKLEHRLQMIEDEQTHTIPKTADGLDHIARFMGYGETQSFENALLNHLRAVQSNYAQLFEAEAPLTIQGGSLVFTGVEDDPKTLDTLAAMGFTAPGDVAGIIRGWHHGRIRATRSPRARERLTKLMPALLDALSNTADPHSAFIHFDRFLSGLPSPYLTI
ncbi:MAG: glutamine-synthetase adenylyltransferase, partial [Proteobacteria bacterium]|nr:glutamine-synthetase adenylyltransferase [Pseudomonadota bacterium]